MPTVPVSHSAQAVLEPPISHRLSTTKEEKPSSIQLRQKLADAVKEETMKEGGVSSSFLDKFAATHLSAQDENSPAVWDYDALRYAAQAEEEQALTQARQAQLKWEGNWISQVGMLTPDYASLKTYLIDQLQSYRRRLETAGFTGEQSQQAADTIRTQTVEKHITRSLAGGDWQTATQVLRGQGKFLSATQRERFSDQVRQCFAQNQARQIWQKAVGQNPAAPYQQALHNLQEPDGKLREEISSALGQMDQEHRRQTAAEKALLFSQLAKAQTSQAYQLLTTQRVLPTESLNRAHQALSQSGRETTAAQRTWFMKNYFKDTLNADDAFDKGLCSARDYFCLQAALQRRQSGQGLRQEKWLCRGIETWMKKQGFDEKDISQVAYEVLSGDTENDGRVQIWKRIKTLLTC